jgi:hypothetical protein
MVTDAKALRTLLERRWANPPANPDLSVLSDAAPVSIWEDAAPITVAAGQTVKIVFRRKVSRARLIGMHFDTAKCLLLPGAMRSTFLPKSARNRHTG